MKLHLYEAGIRVPGILRFPGRAKPGTVCREPVSNLDVLPTLCELAGVRAPGGRVLDGASLLPVFEGRPLRRSTPLHWHYFNALGRPRSAMREGDWKILGIPAAAESRRAGGAFTPEAMGRIKGMTLESFELYNLRQDIGEKKDLAAAEPARTRRMADTLIRLHEQVKAEGPDWRAGG